MGFSLIVRLALPAMLAVMLLEVLLAKRRAVEIEIRDYAASLLAGLGSFILGAAYVPITFAIWNTAYGWRISAPTVSGFGAFALAMIVWDFLFYWRHRLYHHWRWGWAEHSVHHTSQHFNLSTSFRLGWFPILSLQSVLGAPAMLLGISPSLYATCGAIHVVYQVLLHSEGVGRLGPLELLFVTPKHHSIHHASNTEYLDKNFGSVLIVWDRLFGTFASEVPGVRIRFGTLNDIGTFNPLRIATAEYRAIFRDIKERAPARDKFMTVMRSPGWRPNESAAKPNRKVQNDFVS